MQGFADLRVLWQLLRGMPATGSHAERLQRFYAPQAARYDRVRERLLHGRQALLAALDFQPGETVAELGAGTGCNVQWYAGRRASLRQLTLVDLCPALLTQARTRAADWANTRVIEADVTQWQPAAPLDKLYFSYALTMIPAWAAAIDNAIAMLKPGGLLGVVDFYVSEAAPAAGLCRHPVWQRWLWPKWFAHDGVHLSPAHLPYLRARLAPVLLTEGRGGLPWLPGLTVPYYVFVGRKPDAP